VELTPELNSGQALQGFINWFKQAKTISSLKAEFQFSDSLEPRSCPEHSRMEICKRINLYIKASLYKANKPRLQIPPLRSPDYGFTSVGMTANAKVLNMLRIQ
jgi:hypothetical protein